MDDTRERILNAALNLFSENGYSGVGTKSIARAAGVNEVTIFRTFGSKRQLFVEVYQRFSVHAHEVTVPHTLGEDLCAELSTITASVAALFLQNSKIVRMSIKELGNFPEIDSDLREQPHQLEGVILSYLRGVYTSIPLSETPERLAHILVATLMGTVIHLKHVMDERGIYALVEDFTAIFCKGIRA